VAYFMVLSQHFYRRTEKKHKDVIQGSRPLDRESNPGHPDSEVKVDYK